MNADEMKSLRLSKFFNQFYNGKKCATAVRIDAATDFSKMKVGVACAAHPQRMHSVHSTPAVRSTPAACVAE